MKFYKIEAVRSKDSKSDEAPDSDVKWAATQAEAVFCRKSFAEAGFSRKEISTEEVEVPTNKAELLMWLNKNVK